LRASVAWTNYEIKNDFYSNTFMIEYYKTHNTKLTIQNSQEQEKSST